MSDDNDDGTLPTGVAMAWASYDDAAANGSDSDVYDASARFEAEIAAAIAAARAEGEKAGLSDPWRAFAGWQPPPEAKRADGFKCMGFVTGLVDVDDEFVESAAEPEWMIISWQVMSDMTKFWTCVDGIERRPTAFAPLPPPPKESTDG